MLGTESERAKALPAFQFSSQVRLWITWLVYESRAISHMTQRLVTWIIGTLPVGIHLQQFLHSFFLLISLLHLIPNSRDKVDYIPWSIAMDTGSLISTSSLLCVIGLSCMSTLWAATVDLPLNCEECVCRLTWLAFSWKWFSTPSATFALQSTNSLRNTGLLSYHQSENAPMNR